MNGRKGVYDAAGNRVSALSTNGFQLVGSPIAGTFYVLHDKKWGAENALVFAQQIGCWDGYLTVFEGMDKVIFAGHVVRGVQNMA
jgi:hypothetical protein